MPTVNRSARTKRPRRSVTIQLGTATRLGCPVRASACGRSGSTRGLRGPPTGARYGAAEAIPPARKPTCGRSAGAVCPGRPATVQLGIVVLHRIGARRGYPARVPTCVQAETTPRSRRRVTGSRREPTGIADPPARVPTPGRFARMAHRRWLAACTRPGTEGPVDLLARAPASGRCVGAACLRSAVGGARRYAVERQPKSQTGVPAFGRSARRKRSRRSVTVRCGIVGWLGFAAWPVLVVRLDRTRQVPVCGRFAAIAHACWTGIEGSGCRRQAVSVGCRDRFGCAGLCHAWFGGSPECHCRNCFRVVVVGGTAHRLCSFPLIRCVTHR